MTQALAGPFSTMLLADMGADVVKVERPRGDMSRHSNPYAEDDQERAFGGYFASVNRNKRSIVLDLEQEADRDIFLRLVPRYDAVVENYRAGVMEGFGAGYEALRELNPRLVYGAIRGFGDPRTGLSPYADWPAFDVVAQAMGGVVSMTGTLDGDVLKVGPSIGDLYPATLMALGLTAALLHARESGEGQFVDVAMYDSIMALCEAIVYRYSYAGIVTTPMGNSHAQLTPFDIYPTADGHIAIAAPTPKHWELLCAVMDRMDLAEDERTYSNNHRVANAAFVRETMSAWTCTLPTAEIVRLLGGIVPVGPVNNAADLFADPHVAAREMLVAVDHPGASRPMVLPGTPIKFATTPGGIYRRPPRIGEHRDEILAELEGDTP
ncbi:formyl-CoA transferase [bacterium SCGC AG-212-C10]|nr:formyl-CoA transferase [bacterium SCGC AG-212-C10]